MNAPERIIPLAEGAALAAGRHPKWKAVPPGTVIPAGQPYAIEYAHGSPYWAEFISHREFKTWDSLRGIRAWFIDSSWKPPLVLPTEPTWGIAVHTKFEPLMGLWELDGDEFWFRAENQRDQRSWRAHNVLDFIPLTDEQVARIEAAR